MIEKLVINAMDKEEFIEGMNSNRVGITKVNENIYNIFYKVYNKLDYTLTKINDNNYMVSYNDNYEEFTIYLNMVDNVTTIEKAVINGRNYKSAKHLKKFSSLMTLANSFVQFGLLN